MLLQIKFYFLMYAQKDYLYRRTRRGGTVKFCREKYLREDIPCGISFCQKCSNSSDLHPRKLPLLKSGKYDRSVICIVDYKVIVEQMAFIESPEVVNMLFPQTVVQYIKKHNVNLYRRLKICLDDSNKQFYQFFNEFHVDVSSNKAAYIDDDSFIRKGLIYFFSKKLLFLNILSFV